MCNSVSHAIEGGKKVQESVQKSKQVKAMNHN